MQKIITNLEKFRLANSLSDLRSIIMREDYSMVLDESGINWIWEENTEELFKELSGDVDIVLAHNNDSFIKTEFKLIDGHKKKILSGCDNYLDEYWDYLDVLIDYLSGSIEVSDTDLLHSGYVTPEEYMENAPEMMIFVEIVLDKAIENLIGLASHKSDVANIINNESINIRDRLLNLIKEDFDNLEEHLIVDLY